MVSVASLIVFAKIPTPGMVKTRLARHLGDAMAARLARAFLRDTWESVTGLDVVRPVLAVAGTGMLPDLTPAPEIWHQGDGDLGDRMERALRRGIARDGAAIVVGTDAPGRPNAQIARSAELLCNGTEAVLGPTLDGGYHLLGLRQAPKGLLRGLPWGTTDTFVATERRLLEYRLLPVRLPVFYDVDEISDLARLRRDLELGKVHAPHTAAELALLAAPEVNRDPQT